MELWKYSKVQNILVSGHWYDIITLIIMSSCVVQFKMAQEYFQPTEGGILVDVKLRKWFVFSQICPIGFLFKNYCSGFLWKYAPTMLRFHQEGQFHIKYVTFFSSILRIIKASTFFIVVSNFLWRFYCIWLIVSCKTDPECEFCINLALVRADVSRLPFTSGSIDAVHAGAALHCWPSPSNAVSFCYVNLLLLNFVYEELACLHGI